MPNSFVERRRSPRVTLPAGHALQMPLATTVQVVDISVGGALLTSPHAAVPGQTGVLNTRLGAETIRVPVEVCRVAAGRAVAKRAGTYRVGARFTELDEDTRRSIQKFLSQGEL